MSDRQLCVLELTVEQHVRMHQVLRGCACADLWRAHREALPASLRQAVDAADRASVVVARREALAHMPGSQS